MPTPVTVARQCLTPEAAHALDEAVTVARRRGHAQTTSLHAISALLSLQSSALREACARALNSPYSPRLQFKALELCLSVSLDRVSSTQLADDPPLSNSLMAAIKRSQANQRRQPENYHLYHQQQQLSPQQSSISCVKVEIQHLILSILDDPVVSRVFAEAGFRSSEIKLAILRPFPHILRYSRARGHHPLFLCNLTEYSDPVRRSSDFPFFGFLNDGDENPRRIGEVLGRNKGRNSLLVGVCAYDALRSFMEALEKRKDGVLPVELSGLTVICTEKDFSKFITEGCDKGSLNSRFGEVGHLVDQCLGPGLVLNIGDLKAFVADSALSDSVSYVVAQLTRLLELHRGKLWLIGATASYGSYLKFVSRFPSVEKDWDLQLLPITSLRPSSLMDSFVPFGGFFSAPSDLKLPLSCSYQCLPSNHQLNEKCEQEVYAISNGGFTAPVEGQHQASLPSWLQMAPVGTNKGLDMKTKDDGVLLSAKVTGLQNKWDNTCQHLLRSHPPPEANLFPTIVGFQSAEDKKDNHSNNTNISSNKTECKNANACMPIDVQKITTSELSIPPKAKNDSFSSEVWEKPSKDEDLDSGGLRSPCSLSNSSVVDGSRASPTSATSVTTDLGLGICSSPASTKLNKPLNQNQGLQQDISGYFSSDVDLVNGNLSNYTAQSSFCSSPDNHGQFDPSDVKMIFRALFERVGWQIEAISVISQRIAHHRSRSEKSCGASHRGDIWFNFTGPDRYGKKKIAVALAEVLYGSQEQLICVDLNSQDGVIHSDTTTDCQVMNDYEARFRGKTVVDYVAGELCKTPLSIVFLENVDKADVVARNSLSQAVLTGKFSDSHGRQVSTNNALFVTTSKFSKGSSILTSTEGHFHYSKERILQAKGWPVQITIECAFEDSNISQNWRASSNSIKEGIPNPNFLNKRKLVGVNEPPEQHEVSEMPKRANKTSTRYLDLNLPAQENAVQHTDHRSSENDCVSENTKAWLQEFFEQVDETVVFKPVDFDALAEKILKEIKNSFHKFVDSKCLLEIDSEVMDQLLAAVYLSDRNRVVENWVEQVLSRGFAEVQKRYSLNAHTIVKLKTCESLCLEQPAPKTYLPPRIILK